VEHGKEITAFDYDAGRRRVLKQSSASATVYVDGLYEKRTEDGRSLHIFHVYGAEREVAQIVWDGATSAEQVLYIHPDHLGSPETITDAASRVVEKFRFDPFGQRIDDSGAVIEADSPGSTLRHGFTSHEEDAEVGLINMRGRIYDPATGRFLTPDPFVQFPLLRQSLNRYSYVLNNPLTFIDPSGFQSERRPGDPDWPEPPPGSEGPPGSGGSSPATFDTYVIPDAPSSSEPLGQILGDSVQRFYAEQRPAGLNMYESIGRARQNGVFEGLIDFWFDSFNPVDNQFRALSGEQSFGEEVMRELFGVGDEPTPELQEIRDASRSNTQILVAVVSIAVTKGPGGPGPRPHFQFDARIGRYGGFRDLATGRFASAERVLATAPDEAIFWSGIGRGGSERAANWAAQHGGTTLESTLASRGITLPAWDASNPAVVAAWRQAARGFAAGATGEIRVLQGDLLRVDAIWRDEFRALQANPNVNLIRVINPETGTEVLLWSR
ncbi:MAG: hypothetical protein L0Z50_32370, partial [Verrucomicrobiales bacterium]|nr:hypothetical protein [Verrucomicrobiales bacterium]